MTNRKTIDIGDLVALNRLDDAVWFRVVSKQGFRLEVVEDGLENGAVQHTDISLIAQHRKVDNEQV